MRIARSTTVLILLAASVLAGCASDNSPAGVDFEEQNAATAKLLREQVDEMRYMHDQELLSRMYYLAEMGADAAPYVTAGARSDDWLVRSSCMWVLGAIGDRRNIPVVAAGLRDSVPSVRYQAAATLVRLGDTRGFPVLVEGLADGELQNRYKCFQSLRGATGQDFGYRHDAAPEERRQAVARWHDWLESVRTSAL
jgi:HEAT repeat protein